MARFKISRKQTLSLLAVILLLALAPTVTTFLFQKNVSANSNDVPANLAPEQIIMKVKSESIDNETDKGKKALAIAKKYANVFAINQQFKRAEKELSKKNIPHVEKLKNVYTVKVGNASVADVLKKLQKDPEIEFAQYNYVYTSDATPNDPHFPYQWSHTTTSAPAAWDLTTGNSAVTIALIGTGVKWDHQDLAANIWNNTDEINGNGVDDDGNGYVDDVRGWNFELNTNDPQGVDPHETSVAGVAAAVSNNGVGMTGVCWSCKIMPLRVTYTSAHVTEALYYAINNGAKIVNMSFGNYDITKYGPDTVVEGAVNYGYGQGVLMVGTAGNDNVTTKRYPGALENVIAVGSTDMQDARSGFSNWGEWVDMAAPGSGILSTTIAGYGYVNGTSFSAPYVAGVAGLLFSQYPTLTMPDARLILEYKVDKVTTDRQIGSGRINSFSSVQNSQVPTLFAVIKSPNKNFLLPESGNQVFWGTALGDTYSLEYQPEGATTWISIASGSGVINGTLGQLDVSTMPNASFFNVRLTSYKGTESDSHTITIMKNGEYQAGWPQQLGGGPILSAPIVADVDQNGDKEIIVGSDQGKVFVLDHDGTALSGWPQIMPTTNIYGSPAVGDIDGDGDMEIVAASYGSFSTGGSVGAWHADGTVVAGWPKSSGPSRGGPVLANIDDDSQLEVLVNTSSTQSAQVNAWHANGTVVAGWPYTMPDGNLQSSPSYGDVTGDGVGDIVVGNLSWLKVLSHSGSELQSWSRTGTHGDPILADVTDDGVLDIGYPDVNNFVVKDGNGITKWTSAVTAGSYNQSAAGSVIESAQPELFFAGTNSVYAWSPLGTTLSNWPQSTVDDISAGPTIADVNGDAHADVIVPTLSGRVYAWMVDGTLLPGFPKAAGSPIYRAVTVNDIDLDGDTEIIAGTEDGQLIIWEVHESYTVAQPWPQSRANNANSGALTPRIVPTATPTPTPTATPTPTDNTAPEVTITSPANNARVARNKTTLIQATATDNVGVVKVEFLVNNVLKCTDTAASYSCDWLVPSRKNVSYTILVKGYDAKGNIGTQSIQVSSN